MRPRPHKPALVIAFCAALSPASALACDDSAPRNVGRPMAVGSPKALIVASPGIATPAYEPLTEAIESQGVDAWLVCAPLTMQDPDTIVTELIPSARAALPGAPLALVGTGLGGTLAARAALAEAPAALALLGAPLAPPNSALVDWMVAQTVPLGGVDPSRILTVSWHDHPALALLLGSHLPPLERVSATWLRALQAWSRSGSPVNLGGADFPVWAGVGLLDELAPAEGVRPYLGDPAASDHRLVRFGYLHLDMHSFDHAALLRERKPAEALARWLSRKLRSRPGDASPQGD